MDTSTNSFASWTEEERQKRLDEARGGLAYIVARYGEDSEEASSTREEIASIQRASRDAKPFKAHRSLLERKRERLKEKQTRDEAEVERTVAEIDELQTKLKNLRSTIEERGKQISQAEEELAELVRKALAEGDAAGAAGQQEEEAAAPWSAQAASATLQAMASKPGVPPEFAELLAHVFRAAQAMASAAASARPAAGTPPTEGGGERQGHREEQQRQQQQQQQGQLQHPTDTRQPGTNQGADTGKAAKGVGGKGSISSLATTPLAPQSRWTKGASSASTGTGAVASETDMEVDAAGGCGDQGAAAGAADPGDSGAEMVEEEALGPGIDDGVAESINKLPAADQAKLKAALGARGGRRRPADGERDTGAAGDRDRERSPRPTKGGATQNDS